MEGFDTITMSSYLSGAHGQMGALGSAAGPDSLMLPIDTVSNFDNETFFG
jgi:hypothetical protein